MRDANNLQNTGTWFSERTGKLTGSRMAAAMSFLVQRYDKDGKPLPRKEGSDRIRLKKEILAERMTDMIVPKYVSKEMQWGLDMEPEAKEQFETATGLVVTDLGWVPHPTIENLGCSPDGKTSDGCLVEIKCPSTLTMIEWILGDVIPEEHKPQMILQSACLNHIPVYFCAYDPRIKDKSKQLFIRKFEPTKEEIEKIETEAKIFLSELDYLFDQITKGI